MRSKCLNSLVDLIQAYENRLKDLCLPCSFNTALLLKPIACQVKKEDSNNSANNSRPPGFVYLSKGWYTTIGWNDFFRSIITFINLQFYQIPISFWSMVVWLKLWPLQFCSRQWQENSWNYKLQIFRLSWVRPHSLLMVRNHSWVLTV